MKITARAVAEMAGTATSAVSRAFHPGSSIRDDLRERILSAAAELGYRTPSGSAVARLSTNTVSLVAGDLDNPFYPSVLNALSQALLGTDRRLILHVVPVGRDVDSVMQQVLDYKADAAIITSAFLSSSLARTCREKRLPVVLFNRTQPGHDISAVCTDNFAGGLLIGQRLVRAGRKRIAYIAGLQETSTNAERLRGFRAALDEADLPLHAFVDGRYEYATAFDAAQSLFTQAPRVDAVFCANDIMALAAIDAAKATGISVPDDIAIIGFDDIPMASWQSYRLTTIRQQIRLMVRETLSMIDQITEDPSSAGTIRMMPGRLVSRASG